MSPGRCTSMGIRDAHEGKEKGKLRATCYKLRYGMGEGEGGQSGLDSTGRAEERKGKGRE